ncbi:RNA polymerase sigma-54 factor [Thioclava sp. DLFJ4-1]|uniref:RNA polymerase factor sigma-54 n=1 Tax=Thioclava sp. DLFJ4-1 TaxID=1915313 RepID=UPI00099784C7|nr:RNA polymerase sigma-54 factor [Thioclava sp. DLFJ4-1]OOY17307.1 hypothetical protein BMI85_09860 [Thioclava sp. DLFJ4-1]
MKLTQKVTQRLDTQLKLSQELHRAIGFLELSNLELAQTLREAASDNPWLRVRLPPAMEDGTADIAAPGPSLRAHVLGQIDRFAPRPADRPIALALLDAMGPNGFLETPVETIAATLRVPSARVETVLAALQAIEPRGLFARSLGECLALQLAEEEEVSPQMRRMLDVLPVLAERGPTALAEAAGISGNELVPLLARLRDLNPRPASGFSTDATCTRIADLIFKKGGDGWTAQLNPESLPRIEVNDFQQGAGLGTSFSRERSAALQLLSAIQTRNENLLALGKLLAVEQGQFLSEGPVGQRVLTRREAARRLGLHESTVGRLARSSSAATPAMGVLSLREFFSRPLRKGSGVSSPEGAFAVKTRIAQMIAEEDPECPLNDRQLTEALRADGILVSRRVVANLRAGAGIPNRAVRRSRLD